jgi:hypothetical protein
MVKLFVGLVIATMSIADAGRNLHAQAATMSVRDSAGIRMVTHARSASPHSTWRIAPKPILEIGGTASAGPTLFDDIWGAARTPRGEIIVSDNATQQLRMFDSTGKHLRSFGRRGQGPGEFSQIKRVHVRGDSVLALDTNRGTAVFTLDGKLVRQRQHPSFGAYRAVDAWGVLGDGSVLETGAGGQGHPDESTAVGTFTETRGLFRTTPDGRSATLVRMVETMDYHRRATGSRDAGIVAYSPRLSVVPADDRICLGRGVTYELQCVNAAGTPTMIIRRDVARTPVSAGARAQFLQRIRTQKPTPGHDRIPQARLDAIADNTHFATHFPAYGRIAAGVNGELWVSEYRYEVYTRDVGEPAPSGDVTHWNVFARDGSWSASIVLPSRFNLKQVGEDFLLGVSSDDDNVERVTLYRLERSR